MWFSASEFPNIKNRKTDALVKQRPSLVAWPDVRYLKDD